MQSRTKPYRMLARNTSSSPVRAKMGQAARQEAGAAAAWAEAASPESFTRAQITATQGRPSAPGTRKDSRHPTAEASTPEAAQAARCPNTTAKEKIMLAFLRCRSSGKKRASSRTMGVQSMDWLAPLSRLSASIAG